MSHPYQKSKRSKAHWLSLKISFHRFAYLCIVRVVMWLFSTIFTFSACHGVPRSIPLWNLYFVHLFVWCECKHSYSIFCMNGCFENVQIPEIAWELWWKRDTFSAFDVRNLIMQKNHEGINASYNMCILAKKNT